MSWGASGLGDIGLSDLGLSGIGSLSCLGAEPGLGPSARQCRGSRSRTAVRRRTAVHYQAAVGLGPGVGLGAAAAPRGRQDARSAVPAVLSGVLRAGAARAVHDAEAGDAIEASTRRMLRTVRTVPPSVPVTFDFPVRG